MASISAGGRRRMPAVAMMWMLVSVLSDSGICIAEEPSEAPRLFPSSTSIRILLPVLQMSGVQQSKTASSIYMLDFAVRSPLSMHVLTKFPVRAKCMTTGVFAVKYISRMYLLFCISNQWGQRSSRIECMAKKGRQGNFGLQDLALLTDYWQLVSGERVELVDMYS